MMLTYQTRLRLDEKGESIFHEYACLLNRVEHSLYVETTKGKTAASCKNAFLKKWNITARQFNACRVSLDGKISSCREHQILRLSSLKEQISQIKKEIKHLEKKTGKELALHQKKRREIRLSHRLKKIEEDIEHKRIQLCFGGKKLFRSQFFLKENGFASHEEWKKAWQNKRKSEFFLLGSKDETAGNQTCKAILQADGTLSLHLRLPRALEALYGKYFEIKHVSFSNGQEAILASLHDTDGQALSYRFKQDEKGWRVFVSTELKKPEVVSKEGIGVIGIDLNSDHVAYAETDRYGNIIDKKTIPFISYGRSKTQAKSIVGEICKEIVERAVQLKKPIVVEKLDFQKKKAALSGQSKRFARLLSSFAYGLFYGCLASRAYKKGIALHKVNPAFTSVIGHVNYAQRYGLSVHLAAALCIARRYQKFSESPNSSIGVISNGKGSQVAFVLPVRNRTKHVWHFWSCVKKKIATVHAAQYQAIRIRSSSPPSPTCVIASS